MPDVKLLDRGCRVITTKYIPATNTLPSRVKCSLSGTAISATYSWSLCDDQSSSTFGGHSFAAKKLLEHAMTRNGFESWCCDWEIESCYLGLNNVHFVHIIRPIR